MIQQHSFGNYFDDAPPIVNSSEPHMALIFLLDTSGSMGSVINGKKPIDELSKAINAFKEEICKDSQTKGILDVAIIEFNSTYSVIQEFTPIEYMKPVSLQARGQTYMKGAIETAIKMLDERSHFYRSMGTEPYKPWIMLLSDGRPFDNIDELASIINYKADRGQLAFWSVYIPSTEADRGIFHKLSGNRVFVLNNYDFRGLLDWTHKSMRTVSASAPGEKIKGVTLPSTITIDDLM